MRRVDEWHVIEESPLWWAGRILLVVGVTAFLWGLLVLAIG